jgi:hypothetical protein
MASGADGEAAADANAQLALLPGQGKYWGKFVTLNKRADRLTRPFGCALEGCTYSYSRSNANATRVGAHIAGGTSDAKGCRHASAEDRACFPKICKKAESHKRPRENQSPTRAISQYSQSTIETVGAPAAAGTMSMAELVAAQRLEQERQAMLDGSYRYKQMPDLLQYLMERSERKRLDLLWAKAFHHAGIPPNAIEDDYIRAAIYETSKTVVSDDC